MMVIPQNQDVITLKPFSAAAWLKPNIQISL
jgi:hypothetical protein